MRTLIKKCKNDSGQGLVEFALILPLLLMLVLGMLEYGWFLHAKITVNSVSKDAARMVIVAQGEEGVKRAKAAEFIYEQLGTDTMVEWSGTNISSGEMLVVKVTDKVSPIVKLFVTSDQDIVGSATMRME